MYFWKGWQILNRWNSIIFCRKMFQFLEILQTRYFTNDVKIKHERLKLDEMGNVLNFLNVLEHTSIWLVLKFSTCRFLLFYSPSNLLRELFYRCSYLKSCSNCKFSILSIILKLSTRHLTLSNYLDNVISLMLWLVSDIL